MLHMKIYLRLLSLVVVVLGFVPLARAQVQQQGASGSIQTESAPAAIPAEFWSDLGTALKEVSKHISKTLVDQISVGRMQTVLPQTLGEERKFFAQVDAKGALIRLNSLEDSHSLKDGGRGFGGKVLPFSLKFLGNGAYQYSVGVFAYENMNSYQYAKSEKIYGHKENGFTVFNNLRFGTLSVDRGFTRTGVLNTEFEIFGTDARVALAKSEWGWIGATGGAGVNFTLFRQLEGVTESGAPLILATPYMNFPVGYKTYVGTRLEGTGKFVRVALEQRLNYENTGGNSFTDVHNNQGKDSFMGPQQRLSGTYLQTLGDVSIQRKTAGGRPYRVGVEGSLNWGVNQKMTNALTDAKLNWDNTITSTVRDIDMSRLMNIGVIKLYVQY